jgi:hypothetical protein
VREVGSAREIEEGREWGRQRRDKGWESGAAPSGVGLGEGGGARVYKVA